MKKDLIFALVLGLALGVILSGVAIGIKSCNKEKIPSRDATEFPVYIEPTTVGVPTDYNPALDPRYQTTEIPTETETEETIYTEIEETTTIKIETKTEEPTTVPEVIKTQMWTATAVYFRTGPDTHCNYYQTLTKGTEITALDFDWNNEWTQVYHNDNVGYIYTEYLDENFVNKYDYYYINYGNQIEKLDPALQEYAQDILDEWGCRDFFKFFLCQAYQESHYDMNSVGKMHGGYYDYGIMQIWEGHVYNKNSFCYNIMQEHPNYKINPYDNIYVGLWMWHEWYKVTGDYITALGCYLSGTTTPSQTYINSVLEHMNYLSLVQ